MLFSQMSLITTSCYADYSQALSKAKEAAYIQSGLSDKVNKLTDQATKEIYKKAEELNVKEELEFTVGLYGLYKKREVRFKVDENKRLIINTSSVNLEIYL